MQGPYTPPPEEVLAALDSMLACPLFTRAERQSRLLRFIVENSLKGDLEALREISIGLEVYDRPPDFDPKDDTIVRVEASRLRSRLAEYYDGDGRDVPIRISIPRGGYVAAFASPAPAALQHPPATTHSEPPSAPLPSVRVPTTRQAVLAGSAVLFVVVVLVLGWWAWRGRESKITPPAGSSEVKRLLAMARSLSGYYTPASLEEARKLLERAAELAPDSVEVQSALADTYLGAANIDVARRGELASRALRAAERVRDLAPESHLGYTALIRYHRDITMDWNAAKEVCDQAILRASREPHFLGSCATVESLRGDHEVAWTWAERYADAQPENPAARRTLGEVYYRAGQLDRAEAELRKAAALSPKGRVSHWECLALIAVARGKADVGLAELDREAPYAFSKRVDLYAYRGFVAGKAGNRTEAGKMLALVQHEVAARRAAPAFLAWVYLGMGDIAHALDYLEQGVERRDDSAADFIADPATAALRGLPRFQAAARRLGLEQHTGL